MDYLTVLSNCGVLLFIVPDRRRCELFEELLDKCRASGRFKDICVQKPHKSALVDGRILEVCSWDDALDRLVGLHRNMEQSTEQTRRLADIEELRRF